MSGLNPNQVKNSIEFVINRGNMKVVDDYNVTNFSQKLLNIIISYTPYINKYNLYDKK